MRILMLDLRVSQTTSAGTGTRVGVRFVSLR